MTADRDAVSWADADIESVAVRLLAGREHTGAELLRKLLVRGHDPAAVEAVLRDLEQRGLLSDTRFAEQYLAMRVRKGYGPVRIRAELRERGVAPALVASTLDEAGLDWPTLVRDVNRGKFGDAPPVDRKDMARRARFLVQRGFPESLVREILLDDVS